MLSLLGSLNWTGGLVGALLSFLFGMYWFSSRGVGVVWMRSVGKSLEELAETSMRGPITFAIFYQVMLALLVMLVDYYSSDTSIFFVWLAVLFLLVFVSYIIIYVVDRRNVSLFWINLGHEFMIIMIISISILLV